MSEHMEKERELLKTLKAERGKSRPTCLTCQHCMFNDHTVAQGQGECWYLPPVAIPIMGPRGELAGKMGISPPVQLSKQWCAHHKEQLIQVAKTMPVIEKR